MDHSNPKCPEMDRNVQKFAKSKINEPNNDPDP